MPKRKNRIPFEKNLGKILDGLQEKGITIPAFVLSETGRKNALNIYENEEHWTDFVGKEIKWASNLWNTVGYPDTKQNQNNFAFLVSKQLYFTVRDTFYDKGVSEVEFEMFGLSSKVNLMSAFVLERIMTDIFGRPQEEEPYMTDEEQMDLARRIDAVKKEVYKKVRKNRKKRK